ncbi:hypothetical protein VTL71DRAFT_1692 [Oculimacula yallundae]|uniref:Uncharacterized protein n=1 Tax=Oculimacula yallundae TaxID=86028 RepID=A0ABR4CDU1_9HELO
MCPRPDPSSFVICLILVTRLVIAKLLGVLAYLGTYLVECQLQGSDKARLSALLHDFASEPTHELHRGLDPAQRTDRVFWPLTEHLSYFRSGVASEDAVRFSGGVGQGDSHEQDRTGASLSTTSPFCQAHFHFISFAPPYHGDGPNSCCAHGMARRRMRIVLTISAHNSQPYPAFCAGTVWNIIMTQETVFSQTRLQGSPCVLAVRILDKQFELNDPLTLSVASDFIPSSLIGDHRRLVTDSAASPLGIP